MTIASQDRSSGPDTPKRSPRKRRDSHSGPLSVHRLQVHSTVPRRIGPLTIGRERLRTRSLEVFISQLGVLTTGGVTLPEALALIGAESDDPVISRLTRDLAQRLAAGQSLAVALDAHRAILPATVRGVLGSAEISGNLPAAVAGLENHLRRHALLRKRLAGALAYPGIVLVVCLASMALLAIAALPRFSNLFDELGVSAPAPVRWSERVTALTSVWWPLLVLAAMVIVAIPMRLRHRPRWRRRGQRVILRLPVIGRIQRLSLTERVCRTLGLLLDAGVALPDALSTAARASHHVWIEDRLERARDRIVAGDDVVVVLAETGLFTSAVHQILAVGERVGRLAPQMDVAAELIGTELDRRLQRVATLAEPVLVVVVGLIVAGVAISLVSSIYGVVGEL